MGSAPLTLTGIFRYIDNEKTYINTYEYDEANQLVRENDLPGNQTLLYVYDTGGNIVSKTCYAYTLGEITESMTPTKTDTFGYTNSTWKDVLTSYNGQPVTYDAMGNITSFGELTYTWTAGRQLASLATDDSLTRYYYDSDGMLSKYEMYDGNDVLSGICEYFWLDGRLIGTVRHTGNRTASDAVTTTPIVSYDSLDHGKVVRASRYGRGEDYLNCPMTREEYFAFYRALIEAETVPLESFETPRVFEGCMPVEVMAKRGEMTLAFGPMKPVGLEFEGKRPFAVVQLRQDNSKGTLWNIVGFQTNLRFPEQRRVFGMIPGLEHAEFVRYGVMHRNTFLPANVLTPCYEVRQRPGLFFAGQITGVEGYVESAASGLVAGIALAKRLLGEPAPALTKSTAIGALGHYVADYAGSDFQPMNVNYGIMDSIPHAPRNKRERYQLMAQRSLQIVKELQNNL